MVFAEIVKVTEEAVADLGIAHLAVVEVVFLGQQPGRVERLLLLSRQRGLEQELGQGPDPTAADGPWRPAETIVGQRLMAGLAGSPFCFKFFLYC